MKRKLQLLLLILVFGFPLFARQGPGSGNAVSVVRAGFARKMPVIDDPKTLIIPFMGAKMLLSW